jgi:hypothetical protein
VPAALMSPELPLGAYTATVSGKNNTTSLALVEVYKLPLTVVLRRTDRLGNCR